MLALVNNTFFLLYLLLYITKTEGLLLSIVINTILFIIPGFSALFILKKENHSLIYTIFIVLLASSASMIFSLLFHLLFNLPITALSFLSWTFLLTNTILILSKKKYLLFYTDKKICFTAIVLTIIIYPLYYFGAGYGISYLFDCDIERSGTSYGLLYHGKPFLLTDRNTSYFYAHPPLMNLYSAFTILLSGHIQDTKYYYDKAIERIDTLSHQFKKNEQLTFLDKSGEEIISTIRVADKNMVFFDNTLPSEIMLVDCVGKKKYIKTSQQAISRKELDQYRIKTSLNEMEKYYTQTPNFLQGRMPLIFLNVITSIILSAIVFGLTNSVLWTITATALYFSFPEIYILSSSGIYTAIINLAMLFLFYFYIFYDNPSFLFTSGLFCALSSQKTIIFPLAIVIWELSLNLNYSQKIKRLFTNKALLGFLSGMAIFWSYGLLTNTKVFWEEHVQHHLFNRIFHINDLGYSHYPSIGNLWKEFIKNTGGIFFLTAFLSITIFFIKKSFPQKTKLGVIFVWFLTGSFIYSIVDWRVHYHLLLILPPLIIGSILYFSSLANWKKYLILAICLYTIISNICTICQIISSHDFLNTYNFLGLL